MDTQNEQTYSESTLPAVLHLVGTVLINVGIPSNTVTATRKNLETVMRDARRVASIDVFRKQALAEAASRHIVSRLSEALHSVAVSPDDVRGGGLVIRLEDEIESITSSLGTSREGDIGDLINRRDMNKKAVEKSSTLVNLVMKGGHYSHEANAYPTPQESCATKRDILEGLVGVAAARTIESRRQPAGAPSSTTEAPVPQRLTQRSKRLRNTIKAYHAERALVAERMEELRQAMQQLEQDDAELRERISEAEEESEAVQDEMEREAELRRLGRPSEKEETKFDEEVGGLVDSLHTLDMSIRQAIALSGFSAPESNAVSAKLGSYLRSVSNYFTTEAECVEFLRNRIEMLRKAETDIKTEMKEYEELGISATISHLTDSLTSTQRNIEDDQVVIDRLVSEARKMADMVDQKLTRYTSPTRETPDGMRLESMHKRVLQGILVVLETIDGEACAQLRNWVPNAESFPTYVTTSQDEMDSASAVDCASDTKYTLPGDDAQKDSTRAPTTSTQDSTVSVQTPIKIDSSSSLKLSASRAFLPDDEISKALLLADAVAASWTDDDCIALDSGHKSSDALEQPKLLKKLTMSTEATCVSTDTESSTPLATSSLAAAAARQQGNSTTVRRSAATSKQSVDGSMSKGAATKPSRGMRQQYREKANKFERRWPRSVAPTT